MTRLPAHQHSRNDIPAGWGAGMVPRAEDLAGSAGAAHVGYDNSTSGLTATDVQDAIDELAGAVAVGAQVVRVPFTFASAGVTPLYAAPAGVVVRDCAIVVTTPFSDVAATATVGTPVLPASLLDTGDSVLSVVGRYAPSNDILVAVAATVQLTLVPAASVAGAGYVLLTVG